MSIKKKTKIIATIGPASSSPRALSALIRAGVNVVRLNFSHGSHEEHQGHVNAVREASGRTKVPVALLADLSGPKIRTGDFEGDTITLAKGKRVVLTTEKCMGNAARMFVNYSKLPQEIKRGERVLLDDGKLSLVVESKTKTSVTCRVEAGGAIKSRRGVNLPGVALSIPSLTAKDRKDLDFIAQNDVAFVALSFVRKGNDITKLRRELEKRSSRASIVAKIETLEAVENLEEIIAEADAVMVARGDLAIEINHEDVPLVQKRIIHLCNNAGKPVIIATQMLESMIETPVPTRAEVSDVANAILDGADAVMLSGETAIGKHPVAAVEYMTRIAQNVEQEYPQKHPREIVQPKKGTIRTYHTVDAVGTAVVKMANMVDAKAIIALTESGFTARMISRWRPKQPILVLTPEELVTRKALLYFGCYPERIGTFEYISDVTDEVRRSVKRHGIAQKGDKVVIAAGVPFGKVGGTNLVYIFEI